MEDQDLYDEDFEDFTIPPVQAHVVSEINISPKHPIAEALQTDVDRDRDIYSSAASIIVEPVGPEETQASDLYDDDFCSPGPSAILNAGSVVSSDELIDPVKLNDILPKEPSAELSANLTPTGNMQGNHADDSVFYEDDFAVSTDNLVEERSDHSQPPLQPANIQAENHHNIVDQLSVVIGDTAAAPHEDTIQQSDKVTTQEADPPKLHEVNNFQANSTRSISIEQNQDVSIEQENIAAVNDGGNIMQDISAFVVNGFIATASQKIASPDKSTAEHNDNRVQQDDIDNIELDTDDFDISTSEKAVALEEPILAPPVEISPFILVPVEEEENGSPVQQTEECENLTHIVSSTESVVNGLPKNEIVSMQVDISPRPPFIDTAADADATSTISSLNPFADDVLATGLTDTNSQTVSQENALNELLPVLSLPAQPQTGGHETTQRSSAISPEHKLNAAEDNQGGDKKFSTEEAVVEATQLTFTENSLPAEEAHVEQSAEDAQNVIVQEVVAETIPVLAQDTTDISLQPLAVSIDTTLSPVASFVATTVLQAQANVSRPQSAVARDRAIGPFTPTKAVTRPASASPQKMAESFVERTVSQAQINVVMGSPTRGSNSAKVEATTVEVASESAVVKFPSVAVDAVSAPEPAFSLLQPEPIETISDPLLIGEDAMNDHQGESLVLDGIHETHSKSTKSVAYDEFLGTLGLATPSADSKKAAQLRAMVEESREPTADVPAAAVAPAKRLTKKEQQEADRTFLTSLQYHPPPQQTKKIVYSSSAINVRPSTSRPQQPVTKRDLLRGRSAGPNRPVSPVRVAPPPKASVPKRKSLSPNRLKPPVDHRTQFVAPPLCLPSQMMPKDLVNYLFASGKESELKISLFCQHGRHFATCKADLCVDAHEKYRWLNLVHQKAKEACELVSDADHLWREKLEKALVKEVAEKKTELEEELSGLSAKLAKKHNASVKLLKQGVRYYESILPALHSGKVTLQELYKATGWTEEHYEHFRRRLQLEEEGAHFKRKQKLDQLAHKHLEILNELQNSLTSPMMYLDGMLKQRMEKIHSAVKRIDLCFQYSIKLAIGIGKGKSEEELKAETEARSPMRNAIIAERMQRSTKHGFEILKASLAGIADVCSEVRIMYKGIKRDHDLKQEKRLHEAANGGGGNHSRSSSPTQRRRSPSPGGHQKPKARPKSAPSTASPERKKRSSSRPKTRTARSATTRTEKEESNFEATKPNPSRLDRASKVSYGEDFEPHDELEVNNNGDEIGEDSIEIHEGTYEEEMDEMMRDMMGEDRGSRRNNKARTLRDRTVSGGDSSIVEDCISESSSNPQTLTSQNAANTQTKSNTKARPSLTLSVGSAVDEYEQEIEPHLSEKAAVMAKARALALSKSPGGRNYSPNEEDEIASEVEDTIGFSKSNDAGEAPQKISVSNMYEDDFVEEDSLMRHAFASSNKSTKNPSKKHSRKKLTTSQKVAHLMSNDPLVKPLASMKHTQMNEQSILHGILLANNIPIHYTDEPEVTAAHKRRSLIITNTFNQPMVLSLTSPKKVRAKSAESQRPTSPVDAFLAEMRRSIMNPRTSMINSSWNLPIKLARGEGRCFHCQTQFPAGRAKFLPSTAVSSDPEVFEVAKARQKGNSNLFPTYEKIQVTSNTEVQRRWILEQQEKRQESLAPTLLQKSSSSSDKKTSVTHQRFERPYCSWECVKAWSHINFPPQQRYQNDLLIDVNAGYKVIAKAD